MEKYRDIIPDRYQDLVLIGSGQASRVYRALDTKKNIHIAIKIARKEIFSWHIKKDFEILSDLNHPNLCRVISIDHYKKENLIILYSEYIEGQNIFEASHPLDYKILSNRLREILLALDYIHSRGLVHLDIKIDNILVQKAKRAGDPEIKILDFGISKKTGDMKDRKLLGTIHYMAPEIIQNNRINHKSDLYSLGVVLFKILTSDFPFDGRTINQIIEKILNSSPAQPYILNPKIPSYFSIIIENLLQKEPEHRFDSAGEILDLLNSYTEVYKGESLNQKNIVHPAPFIGRDNLTKNIDDLIQNSFEGKTDTRFIFLYGEKGIGKTSILKRVFNQQLLKGYTAVLSNPRLDSKIPYELIFDLLSLFMETNAGFEYKKEIQSLIDDYLDIADRDIMIKRDRIFSSLKHFLDSIAKDLRIIFIIDNFEIIDRSNIELLNYILSADNNIVFLSAVSDDKQEEISNQFIFPYKKLYIESLDDEQIQEIMNALSGGADINTAIKDHIISHSGGNPTIAIEMFRQIWKNYQKGFDVESGFDAGISIKNRFKEIFSRKVDELSEDEILLLKYTALFNLPFRIDTINELLNNILNDIPSMIHRLIDKDILEHMKGEAFIRTKRMIYNDIILERIDKDSYKNIHKEIALFYEEKKKDNPQIPDEEIAYHYIEAQDKGKTSYIISIIENIIKKGSMGQAISMLESMLNYIEYSEKCFDDMIFLLFNCYYYSGNYRKILKSIYKLEKCIDQKNTFYMKLILYKGKVLGELSRYEEGISALNAIENDIKSDEDIELYYNYLLNLFLLYIRSGNNENIPGSLTEKVYNSMNSGDMPDKIKCEIWMALANMHYISHKFDKALAYWEKAYHYYKKINDLYGLSRTTNNISLVNMNYGSLRKALEFMNESLEYDKALGNMPSLAKTYGNIGVLYQFSNDFPRALKYYKESLIIRERLNLSDIYKTYNNIIYIYYVLSMYKNAFDLLDKIPHLSSDMPQEYYEKHMLRAKCLLSIGDYPKARKIVKDLINEFDEINLEMHAVLLEASYYLGFKDEFDEIIKNVFNTIMSQNYIFEKHNNSLYEMLEFMSEENLLADKSNIIEKFLSLENTKNAEIYASNILYCLSYLSKDKYKSLEFISQAIKLEEKTARPFKLFKMFYKKAYILIDLEQYEPAKIIMKKTDYFLNQIIDNIPKDLQKHFNDSSYYKNFHKLRDRL